MNYIKLICYFLFFTMSAVLIIMFQYSDKRFVQSEDYNHYLTDNFLARKTVELNRQFGFWNKKLITSPKNQVYQKKIAGLSTRRFKTTGNISYLHQADSLYLLLNKRFPKDVAVLHGLTANAITRHAFKQAEEYSLNAYCLGEKKFQTSLLMTDVYLERGHFENAFDKLQDIASKEHFDYFIRAVKWYDQIGKLDKAVNCMEQALVIAKRSKDKALINWSLSNLADMYGHQGAISKSYDTYLEALENNPIDFHSLKGIAWIAYSNDKNTEEAKRILHFLKKTHPIPDYDLLLAEIAEFENDSIAQDHYITTFKEQASHPSYGKMYQPYLCLLYAEDSDSVQKAVKIASTEVEERPHPMSYNLKAWSYFKEGKKDEAMHILYKYVLGQTEEPDALFHAGIILDENNEKALAKKYLLMARDAEFELGPLVSLTVKKRLENI